MNRLGMVLDPSHASDAAFDSMLERSSTPLFLSHSGSRTMFDCPRNLDDGRIRALADAGGVIGITTVFLSPLRAGRERRLLMERLSRIGTLIPDDQGELCKRWRDLSVSEPMWDANLDAFMAALLHVIDVAGIDHVAFGSDFDGGGGIRDLEDVTSLPSITARLQAAGLSDGDIAKFWGGNVLRILRMAEDAALV